MYHLKLSPKKCHFLRDSVKFLGHFISGNGNSVDSTKVDVISKMSKLQLMEEDGCTPSARRIKSFLGMIFTINTSFLIVLQLPSPSLL